MKKILFWIIVSFVISISVLIPVFAWPPSFEEQFVKPLSETTQQKYGNETLRDRSTLWLDKNKSIQENIKTLFYPDVGQGGTLRDIMKIIGLIVFVLALVWQWFQYVLYSDEESKIEEYHINIAYIFLWAIIFFSTTRILSIGLGLSTDNTISTTILLNKLDNNIMFQIFAWLRAGAFFIAIVLLMFYGYRMIISMEEEEKLNTMKQWILNVIYALVFIKVIDYIYFIAQSPDFKSKATEFIVEVSKILWYLLWGFFTLSVIFYGFRLMFSNGDEAALTKVKDVIIAILLSTVVLFLFFLIVYQIVQEFAL